jgi:hypothetical protein
MPSPCRKRENSKSPQKKYELPPSQLPKTEKSISKHAVKQVPLLLSSSTLPKKIRPTDTLTIYNYFFPVAYSLYSYSAHFIKIRPGILSSPLSVQHKASSSVNPTLPRKHRLLVPDTPLKNLLFKTFIEVQELPSSQIGLNATFTTRVKSVEELKV